MSFILQITHKNAVEKLPFLCKKCSFLNQIAENFHQKGNFITFAKISHLTNHMNRTFHPMTIKSIVELLEDIDFKVEGLVIRERLGINLNLQKSLTPETVLAKLTVPYNVQDNRLLRILSGQATIEINFTEYRVSQGDVILIKEGSYFEAISVSDDMKGEVLAFLPENYQSSLLQHDPDPVLIHPDQNDWNKISHLLYTIHGFASEEPYRKDITEPMIIALLNFVIMREDKHEKKQPSTAAEGLFYRFMSILSSNRSGKHTVAYYADKLCVTPQYLSRTVSQSSGKTVSEWINKAVITEAKVLLKDTSRSVLEISESMNFPNVSFFCRFFKGETGVTPTQYRRRQ